MYTQKSFLRRVADQLLFTQLEILAIVLMSGGIALYAILIRIKETSQEVAQLSSFFENSVMKSISDRVSSVASAVATADIATMILWAIVGAVVYVLFLGGLSFLKGAKDTVWSSFRFTHPSGRSSSQFFIASILERGLQLLISFVFILYSATLVNAVFPLVFNQVQARIDAYSLESLWLVLYIVELTVAVHVWVFLWRLVIGRHWSEE